MAQRTSSPQGTRDKTSGLVIVFRAVVIITVIAIATEFCLAGLGTFDGVHSGAAAGDTSAFDPHKTGGYVIAALGAVLVILAVAARLGGRTVGMAAGVLVLAGPVQAILAHAGENDDAFWGALHGLVGALILGLVVALARTPAPAPRAG